MSLGPKWLLKQLGPAGFFMMYLVTALELTEDPRSLGRITYRYKNG